MRDTSLKMFVDHKPAALVRRQPGRLNSQLVAVGFSSDRVQQGLSANLLSALQRRKNLVPLFVEAHRYHFLPDPEDRPQLPQLEAQAFDNLPIHKIQQRRTLIEQRHLHPQRREHGRIFQPDNPRPHYNQLPRYLLQAVHLIRIEDALPVDRNPVDVRWPRATGD